MSALASALMSVGCIPRRDLRRVDRRDKKRQVMDFDKRSDELVDFGMIHEPADAEG